MHVCASSEHAYVSPPAPKQRADRRAGERDVRGGGAIDGGGFEGGDNRRRAEDAQDLPGCQPGIRGGGGGGWAVVPEKIRAGQRLMSEAPAQMRLASRPVWRGSRGRMVERGGRRRGEGEPSDRSDLPSLWPEGRSRGGLARWWPCRDHAGSPAEDAFLQLSQPTSSVALSNPQCPGLGTAKEPSVSQIFPLGEEQPSCSSVMEVAMAVKDIKHFMDNFDLDLASVTQAFLKNSGEVAAVVSCLLTGQRLDGCPLWNTQDDVDLIKGEEKLRSRLIAKYGAESVTRRMAFRKS